MAPKAAFAPLVWLSVALLSLPLATMAGRTTATTGQPAGQLPNQSEEESESWPKTEVRHTNHASGTGGPRGRQPAGIRLIAARPACGLLNAGRGLRPHQYSELLDRNGTGGRLRC
jgi:hypothetical protein